MTLDPQYRLLDPATAQEDMTSAQRGFTSDPTRRVPIRLLTAGLWLVVAAVVLWGLEYRLSLYRLHRSATGRASIARLWVESKSHRDALAARSPVNQPNHNFTVYLAGAGGRGGSAEFSLHCFVKPVRAAVVRVGSVSPRSPPRARDISGRCLPGAYSLAGA